MKENNRTSLFAVLAVLGCIILAIVYMKTLPPKSVADIPLSTTENPSAPPSSTSSTPASAVQKQTASATIKVASIGNTAPGIPVPNIDKPYTPPSYLPASLQEKSRQEVTFAKQQLRFDPNNKAYWVTLAPYLKAAGDYAGAEEIWLYCTKRWPTEPICYNNLGDLYTSYTHNFDKAEVYWNKLIELQPKNISAYINLANMHSLSLHDVQKAQATIDRGLKANPQDVDLLQYENQLQNTK